MANLQYTVTRVFSQSYGAYHKRDTLELLRRNPRLTPQEMANLQNTFPPANLMVVIIRATFWTIYGEILT